MQDYNDDMDLGAYRHAVARVLRLLIRARLAQESEFLNADDRRRWNDEITRQGSRSVESLLVEAAKANDILYNEFVGPGNSGGIDPGDPRSDFKESVIGVMTSLWSHGDQWISNVRSAESVEWDVVIPIDVVRLIRDGLDSLPNPKQRMVKGEDGPVPPALFRHAEREATFTPKPWSLVNFLWSQRPYQQGEEIHRSADFGQLALEVWGDEDVEFGRAIPSAVSHANSAFEAGEIPIRLHTCKLDGKTRFVVLAIASTNAK